MRVANGDGALLAGMYAAARLVVAHVDDAIGVPRESVVTRDGERVVMRVEGESVRPVPVVEGLSDGRRVQIVAGLRAGDQVLADARRQLPADARVRPVLQGGSSR